jgi:hypothetical protein
VSFAARSTWRDGAADRAEPIAHCDRHINFTGKLTFPGSELEHSARPKIALSEAGRGS